MRTASVLSSSSCYQISLQSCHTDHNVLAYRTFKNLTKAIQAFIPTASLPLPQDLVEILEAYIQKHENKFDGNTADKANEELLSIFNRDIIQTPVRYAPFMAIIRRLRPLVVKADKIFQWFDLLLPVLDHINQEKGLAAECQGTMLDAMTADDVHDSKIPDKRAAILLVEHHITIWLEECGIIRRNNDATRTVKEKFFRETLVLYGKRRPRVINHPNSVHYDASDTCFFAGTYGSP